MYADNNPRKFLRTGVKGTKAQLDRIASRNDEAARFAARISSVRSGSILHRQVMQQYIFQLVIKAGG